MCTLYRCTSATCILTELPLVMMLHFLVSLNTGRCLTASVTERFFAPFIHSCLFLNDPPVFIKIKLEDGPLAWWCKMVLGTHPISVCLGSRPSLVLDSTFLLMGTLGDRDDVFQSLGSWYSCGRP